MGVRSCLLISLAVMAAAGSTLFAQVDAATLSGSVTDPSGAMKDAYTRAITARGGDISQLKFESEISDVKIVLADGTEIPADVVLRDKDLDLAYRLKRAGWRVSLP